VSPDSTSLSNLELARDAVLRPVAEVAEGLGLEPDEVQPYGRFKAKIELGALGRLAAAPDGKLVCVTAITPTKAGEGKTTTAISLADGLARVGAKPLLCLREPSLGPVFGIKGGGAGGGRSQVAPMEEINLHFTGDIHAIGAANNLLAAMLEAHLLHGNALGIDPHTITWRRCLDMNDRALRQLVLGLGGRANGFPRESGFDITAASEVMAIVAVARDVPDLRHRLGAITVAQTREGEPVTAEQLKAAGAMTVLLRDALQPNLVQTLEGNPALVHCGPFGNIAHGNSSLVADLLGLKLADYVITESGFGSDMGFEKLADIVCRLGDLRPAAVVIVATAKALKHHGGEPEGGLDAIERGADNLTAHLGIVREFGLDAVVAVNRFPGDSDVEIDRVRRLALERGALAAEINDAPRRGGEGSSALAEAVIEAADRSTRFDFLYSLDDSVLEKLEAIAIRVYGASGVTLLPAAQARLGELERSGAHRLPVCMAKTQMSLSHDPTLQGVPVGFTLPVRDLRPYTGAGWIVALCGDMQTMPGLSASPAAFGIDLGVDGSTVGLF
jgi:formate--tetrahydrofolate ligase